MIFDFRAWQKHAEEVLNTPIPQSLIQTRTQSGQTLNYINSATASAILNRAFGPGGWEFVKVDCGVRESMEDKYGKKGNTMVYEGELHVFIPDAVTGVISRNNYANFPGFGTKTLFGGANEDQMADKSAQSDCFKKCASILGVGSQLYFKEKSMFKALSDFLSNLGVEPEPSAWDNPEVVELHRAEWSYLSQIKEETEASDEDLDEMADKWSVGLYKTVRAIPPESFAGFIAYMQNLMNENAEASMIEEAH